MSLLRGRYKLLLLIGFFSGKLLVGETPQPPVAPVFEHRETRHGTIVTDNYFWLREKSNPEVLKYLKAENTYTTAMTQGLAAAFCTYASAANLKVNCNGTGALSTINGALKLLSPQGPNTLTVSGNCRENVVIASFDNLTLQAASGASINDASAGTVDVITIEDSQRVTVQGFTINGGIEGIICFSRSLCRFSGNTIQGSAGDGVSISRSRAEFIADVIQSNPNGRGLVIREAGEALTTDTIQGSGAAGVVVIDGSFLILRTIPVDHATLSCRYPDLHHGLLRSTPPFACANGLVHSEKRGRRLRYPPPLACSVAHPSSKRESSG